MYMLRESKNIGSYVIQKSSKLKDEQKIRK